MKIYTKTGDNGETGLYRGKRIGKDSARIEAIGDVDELNATIGVAIACLGSPTLKTPLTKIQDELFALGAELASLNPVEAKTDFLTTENIAQLESLIDVFDVQVPPLKAFILPGGSVGGAQLHVARTVCRRAERRVATLRKVEVLRDICLVYLNRLADLLFVLARVENQIAGQIETPWNPPKRS